MCLVKVRGLVKDIVRVTVRVSFQGFGKSSCKWDVGQKSPLSLYCNSIYSFILGSVSPSYFFPFSSLWKIFPSGCSFHLNLTSSDIPFSVNSFFICCKMAS